MSGDLILCWNGGRVGEIHWKGRENENYRQEEKTEYSEILTIDVLFGLFLMIPNIQVSR